MNKKPTLALFSEKEKAAKKVEGKIKDEMISHPLFQKLVSGEKLTEEEKRILRAQKKAHDRQISELK